MKNFILAALAIIAIGSLAGNAFLYLRYSSSRPVVQMGKDKITVKEMQDALEYAAGKPILNKLVYTQMVRRAAEQAGVTPSSKDVDARIAEIERTRPALLEDAKRDAEKMRLLRRDIETDIALDNLRIKDIKVTDSEVANFYSKNKAAFVLPKQAQSILVVTDNKNNADTAQAMLKQNLKPEVIAESPGLRVVGVHGFSPDWRTLPSADNQRLSQAVFKLKKGEVTTVALSGTPPVYVTAKLTGSSEVTIPSLDKIKDKVTRILKLSKAIPPASELKKIYDASNITFEVEKYRSYFDDMRQMKVADAATTKR